MRRRRSSSRMHNVVLAVLATCLGVALLSQQQPSLFFCSAADDDYYGEDFDDDAAANANYDDAYYGGGDDDGNFENNNDGDDNYGYQNDAGRDDMDDDFFHWYPNLGFDGVSVMPISCINYNNGHMVKFQLFDTEKSYQCHLGEISTFVVSIAHYMRAYFNYQALTEGYDFSLPSDAAYLNCIQLEQEQEDGRPLYAKIGCMERATFTSTRLQLHVYTDAQCSQLYSDGMSARRHQRTGYMVGDQLISSHVSFKPPFYSCLTCSPQEISGTFNKKNGNWYDDDYIAQNGQKEGNDDDQDQDNDNDGDDDQAGDDDAVDDAYYNVNDDVAQFDDDAKYNYNYNYNNGNNDDAAGDDYYAAADDDGGRRRFLTASTQDLQAYHTEFWQEYDTMIQQRSLYDNNDYYNIGDWNMCQRIYKYGVWCDEECRALDFFRTDQWSASDVFLLAIMTTFMTAMMLLVVAKRLKAQQRSRIYGEDQPMPGLPPFAMALIFCVIMSVIITLAKLKFINETLVFAVVTCILLFIYMLKLTLFETRRPVLLAAPRHDMFDNPLDEEFLRG